jgi:hypothetical protein
MSFSPVVAHDPNRSFPRKSLTGSSTACGRICMCHVPDLLIDLGLDCRLLANQSPRGIMLGATGLGRKVLRVDRIGELL